MIKIFPILILIVMSITGCVQKLILDDISIESGMGYDLNDEGNIYGTAIVHNYLPNKEVKNVNYTAESTKTHEIFLEMQRQSADPLVPGSLEVVLFGEKYAKKGIIDAVDILQRDATIGERLYLGVVEGTAEELLKQVYGKSGNATFISNLFKNNIESYDLPKNNLHLFLYDFFQQGKDPYLPRIKNIGPKKLIISGVSLMKDDKVVDTIPNSKMFFFKLLADKYSQGFYKVWLDGEHAGIHSISSRHNFVLSKKNPAEITIKIKIKGAIREYSGKKINKKLIKRIEKKLEKTVNRESVLLINRFKELGVDPLGIGFFVKTKTRNFDMKKWENNYKNVTVKVKTNVVITEAGVIE